MVDIDTFHEMANEMFEEIPPELLEGLNGGIIISEATEQRDPDLPDVHVMGEYIEDPDGLGCYIVLYYGSFCAVLGDEEIEVWEDELWETMVHEIRHHVEARAGVDDLDMEDLRDMIEFYRQAREAQEPGDDRRGDEAEDDVAEDDGPGSGGRQGVKQKKGNDRRGFLWRGGRRR